MRGRGNYRAYFCVAGNDDDDDGINRSRREGRAPLAKPWGSEEDGSRHSSVVGQEGDWCRYSCSCR